MIFIGSSAVEFDSNQLHSSRHGCRCAALLREASRTGGCTEAVGATAVREQEAQLDIAPRNQRRWRASSYFDGGNSRRRRIARTADGTARGQNGSPRWAGQPDLRRCGGRANDLQAYLLLAWRSENPSLPRSQISVFALPSYELKIPAMLVNC